MTPAGGRGLRTRVWSGRHPDDPAAEIGRSPSRDREVPRWLKSAPRSPSSAPGRRACCWARCRGRRRQRHPRTPGPGLCRGPHPCRRAEQGTVDLLAGRRRCRLRRGALSMTASRSPSQARAIASISATHGQDGHGLWPDRGDARSDRARLAAGRPLTFRPPTWRSMVPTRTPSLTYLKDGTTHTLRCDYVAGCDGYHGVSRRTSAAPAVPTIGSIPSAGSASSPTCRRPRTS